MTTNRGLCEGHTSPEKLCEHHDHHFWVLWRPWMTLQSNRISTFNTISELCEDHDYGYVELPEYHKHHGRARAIPPHGHHRDTWTPQPSSLPPPLLQSLVNTMTTNQESYVTLLTRVTDLHELPPPCSDVLMPTPPSSQSSVDTMTMSQGCLNYTISTVTRYMTSTINFVQSCQCHDKCCRVVGTPWWASQTIWTQPPPTSQGHGNTRPQSHGYLTTTSTTIMMVCEYHDQPHRVTRTTPATAL